MLRHLHGVQRTLRAAARPVSLISVAVLAITSGSCFTQGETTCGQESAARAPIRGKVINAKTGEPVGGSLVFIELCRLYSENPDPAKGHPNYRYGTIAAADGTYEVVIPKGPAGVHTFKDGFSYGAYVFDDSTVVATSQERRVEPLDNAVGRPTVSDFKVTPSVVAPGGALRFSVNARAAAPKQPLSEEVLILEDTTKVARALDPPRRGVVGVGYPDGLWSTTIEAPVTPGNYTYHLGLTSEGCVNSNQLSLEITVQ